MHIIIEEKIKDIKIKGTYVASFPSVEHPPFASYKFPVTLNDTNAEQVLHVLNALCHHPEVYPYLKSRIPSPFFPGKKVRNRRIPIEALLRYLAGPSNMFCLEWKEENVEYIKEPNGIAISHFSTNYIFPLASPFTSAFIEAYGEKQWQETLQKQVLTGYDFSRSNHPIPTYLAPYETWFIASHHYNKLCFDLRNICSEIENILYLCLFIWEDAHEELKLVNIIKEESGLGS